MKIIKLLAPFVILASSITLPGLAQVTGPDLVILGGRTRDMAGQKVVEIFVQNRGSSLATGINGVCSYECQSRGIRVTNQSFLQGGYLVPGRVVNGFLGLTPCPDRTIFLDCIVDPNNVIRETNEANNRRSGQIRIN
jgi:hypothetical protein